MRGDTVMKRPSNSPDKIKITRDLWRNHIDVADLPVLVGVCCVGFSLDGVWSWRMKLAVAPINKPTSAATMNAATRSIRRYFFLSFLLAIEFPEGAVDVAIRLEYRGENAVAPESQGKFAAHSEI